MHALLYLIVSLLAVAVMFLRPGRAVCCGPGGDHLRGRHHGALCLAIMMLNLGPQSRPDGRWAKARPMVLAGPTAVVLGVLMVELIYVLCAG